MTPKVSVIMPVYNTEKYLERAVQSIIDQTIINWELILVDDGSTDQSSAICEHYSGIDSRIKFFRQNNRGPSDARNKGIEKATGEYIAFLDSDDWFTLDMLETMTSICDEYNVEIACCSFFIAHENGSIIEQSKTGTEFELLNTKEAIYELINDRRIQSFLWNKMYKRQLFEGILFPVGKHYATIFKEIIVLHIPLNMRQQLLIIMIT